MNKVRATAGLGATTAMLAIGWLILHPAVPTALTAEPAASIGWPEPVVPPAKVVGSVGCSGVACHGAPVTGLVPKSGWGRAEADDQRWRSSFTVWKCYDPHGRAFEVLGNDRSRHIESRLVNAGETPLSAKADVRCLACHANPTLANSPAHPLLADGVSCEACHGNAGPWIGEHTGWPAGPDHAAMYGSMTHLNDPAIRAATCAGCHVGAPASAMTPVRDVNHDLIAAGHPRLNFDYATYLRALPPHWVERDRDVSPVMLRPAGDEFRHWLVGRAATAAAAYRLRTERVAHPSWPELAEFDCYSCHHGLTGKAATAGRSGSLVWNEPPLAAALGASDDAVRPVPRPGDGAAIGQHANEAAAKWQLRADRWAAEPVAAARVAERLAHVKPDRWDEACQLYYALLAIDRAGPPRPVDPRLAELQVILKLPRDAEGVRFNSPKGFDPSGLPFADLFRLRAGLAR